METNNPIPIVQQIAFNAFTKSKIKLFILRLDLLGGNIQGNKWYKLKYNLLQAKKDGQKTVLSFGGAFSNHIYALAYATKQHGLNSIGIIRGQRVEPLNSTLKFAEDCGMQLHFISREEYRLKKEANFIKKLREQFGDFYLIPEGGTNELAVKGTAEILKSINLNFDYCACSIGTGGTFCGLLSSLSNSQTMLGFSALKGNFIHQEIDVMITKYNIDKSTSNYFLFDNYHFGGFAKIKPELIQFMADFKSQTQIQLEPIYTAKMFYGLHDLANNNHFQPNTTILAIHTGGLQSLHGFSQRLGLRF